MGKQAAHKKKAAKAARRAALEQQQQQAHGQTPDAAAAAAPTSTTTTTTTAPAPATYQEVVPIVRKLKAASHDDRAWAATSISNMVLEADMRKKLLGAGVVGALLECLADPAAEVRVEACGALRNLVVAGGDQVAADFAARGAPQHLAGLLDNVQPTIAARLADVAREKNGEVVDKLESEAAIADRAACFDVAEQLVSVLWSLSERFDETVRLLTYSRSIFHFLIDLLNPEHEIPWKLVQVSAQCLNTLTDENPGCFPVFVQHPEYAERLAAIASGSVTGFSTWDDNRLLLRPLCGNILYNIRSALLDQSAFAGHLLYGSIYNSITVALDYDVAEALATAVKVERAMEATAAIQPPTAENVSIEIQDLVQRDSERMAVLEQNLETVQLALELLANVVIVDHVADGWETMEAGEGDDDEEMMDSDDVIKGDEEEDDEDDAAAKMEADSDILEAMREVTDVTNGTGSSDADVKGEDLDPVLQMFLDEFPTLFPKVLQLIAPIETASATTLDFSAHIAVVQTRALTTLSNILSTPLASRLLVATNPTTTTRIPSGLWSALFAVPTGTPELVDATLSALLSLLQSIDTRPILRFSPPDVHVAALLHTLTSPTVPPPQTLEKCVTVLSLIAKHSTSVPVVDQIATTFLQLLVASPTPGHVTTALQTDILNAFYDVFPDAAADPTDCVFRDRGMVEVLAGFVPTFRERVRRTDRRKMRDVRERADEALVNLEAFVVYKRGEYKA
ncbi:hypothetical protein HKX48_002309, partial [Thoreauomyces humboldtii]